MICRLVFLSLFLFPLLLRAETTLLDADFTPGRLPPGFSDNASTAVKPHYEPTPPSDHVPALRISRDHGTLEITTALPPSAAKSDAYYRLTLRARSVTRTQLQLLLRPTTTAKKSVWSARPEPTEILSDINFLFQLPKQSQPLDLILSLSQDGSLDIASLKLVELTRDELIAEMKRQFPKGGSRVNLLRVSRFPQGVQSGGSIGRDRSDEQFTCEGDPDLLGPSGAPSLKLQCPQSLRFFLPPITIPWTFTPHTASVYLQGHGSGALSIIADGIPVGSVPFSVNFDTFTRFSFTFNPAFLAREHQLVLDTTGAIHADAFQLEPGDHPTDYIERPEVSLSMPKTDASVVRIQFDDDPAVVDFAVTGGGTNTLNTRVFSVYGDHKDLPDIALVGNPVGQGSLQYEVFPGHSLGAFRVEAWIEDPAGKRISPYNEIVVTRVRRPRAWDDDAPDSPFGAHIGPIHRQMVLAKAVGINWVRLHDAGVDAVGWASVEPEKGQFHFLDDNIKRYRDHHLSILATLSQSPGWASGLGHPVSGYWDKYLEPTNLSDFSNYVRTTTSHYKDSIQAWDIWNEPWNKFWSKWNPKTNESYRSPTAAADYARLEDAAYRAAKSVSPTFTILGLNTTGGRYGYNWTRDVAAANGLAPCDAYSYHSYSSEFAGFPNDVASRHFHDAFDAIPKKPHPTTAPTTAPAVDKPFWMTEGSGTNLLITRGLYHYSAPGEDAEDVIEISDRLARYESSTLAQGAQKIFLYHLNVGGEFRAGPGSFQSLVTDDGFPDPSAAAHATLAWHLEGKKFVKRIEPAPGIFATIFYGDDHSIAVLTSSPGPHPPYPFPADVIALDVRDLFGNDLPPRSLFTGRTAYVDLQGTPAELEKALKPAKQKE